jgi:hypothetical protein
MHPAIGFLVDLPPRESLPQQSFGPVPGGSTETAQAAAPSSTTSASASSAGAAHHVSRGEQRTIIGCIGDETLLERGAAAAAAGAWSR